MTKAETSTRRMLKAAVDCMRMASVALASVQVAGRPGHADAISKTAHHVAEAIASVEALHRWIEKDTTK